MKVEVCDRTECKAPLGVSVIYDHGKKYHPDCYAIVAAEKMKNMVRNWPDWSVGKYED